jgi:hypothetical protein
MQDHAYVQAFAVQVPWWAAVLIILAIAVGIWKLARIFWAVISE